MMQGTFTFQQRAENVLDEIEEVRDSFYYIRETLSYLTAGLMGYNYSGFAPGTGMRYNPDVVREELEKYMPMTIKQYLEKMAPGGKYQGSPNKQAKAWDALNEIIKYLDDIKEVYKMNQ